MDRSVCVIGREKGTSFWRITAFFFYSLRLEIWEAIGLTSDIKWEEEGEREMARWSWQHWLPCLPCPPVGQGTEPPRCLDAAGHVGCSCHHGRIRSCPRNAAHDESNVDATPRLGALQYQCLDIYSLPLIPCCCWPVIPSGQRHPQ